MPFFRFTFHFGYKKWGWNESLDWSFPDTSMNRALAYAGFLGLSRRRFLSDLCRLEGVSVARVDDQGRAFTVGVGEIKFDGTGQGAGSIATGSNCFTLWQALYVRLYDRDSKYASNLHFRGIVPRELACNILAGVPIDRNTVSALGLANYLLILTGQNDGVIGQLGFFAVDKNLGRSLSIPITAAQLDMDGRLWISTAPGNNFALGERVHFHGFTGNGTQGLDGDARIVGPLGTVAPNIGFYPTSRFQLGGGCTFDYLKGAVVWRIRKTFVAYSRYTLGRVTNRKTGATMFGTKGNNKQAR